MPEEQYNGTLYATIAFRVKASIIDSTILLALIILIPLSVNQFVSHAGFRALLMYSPLLFLEPLLVSYTGSTIGQRIVGITVVNQADKTRCSLPMSFVRYFVKIVLGWFSLVLMFFTRKHQAIHDHLAKTIVILSPLRISKKPSFAAAGEREQEEEAGFAYPSVLRRFMFFLLWAFVADILLALAFYGAAYILAPDSISDDGDLPKSVERIERYLDLVLVLFIASLAARGLLPGAKKIAK